jgi:tripartite-type tricarboxylate transporter receptor subunit TctC
MFRCTALPAAVAATLACLSAAGAHAQTYPNKPIRLIVPLATGGTTDILARLFAGRMSELLGQSIIVDNRTGAGGNIGNELAAKSPPDGYTLLMTAPPLVINAVLSKNPGYHPINDFSPISMVASVPVVLAVHPSVPAKSVKELIALVKGAPGRYNFSSSGIGSTNQLAGALFNTMASVELVHVAYKGSAPAMMDLLGGQVHMQFSGLPPLLPFIKSGKLRALGIAGTKRTASLPDVPTISESGLPGYEATSWQGLSAPANLPDPIMKTLHGTITKIMSVPEVQARVQELGADPVGNMPAEFAKFIRSEFEKWGPIIRQTGARAE